MQLVINIPFQKTLIVFTFVALLVKVIYSIVMMVMGYSFEATDASLITVKQIIDIVMWSMITLWFLVLFLYESEMIGHRGLNIVTSLTTLTVMIKSLASIFFVIYFIQPTKWTIFFSVVELIIWIGLFLCMILAWFSSKRMA